MTFARLKPLKRLYLCFKLISLKDSKKSFFFGSFWKNERVFEVKKKEGLNFVHEYPVFSFTKLSFLQKEKVFRFIERRRKLLFGEGKKKKPFLKKMKKFWGKI